MKKAVFSLLHAAGITWLVSSLNRRRVVFLCYHSVTPRPKTTPHDPLWLHLDIKDFETHLEHLRRNYHVISISDYLEARRDGRPLPPRSVVLTFDDGYRNFLTVVAPLLARHGLPATVFIVTDKATHAEEPVSGDVWRKEDDHTYLSWTEMARLAREQGVEFGSHTCSHPRINAIALEEAERELRDSHAAISARLRGYTSALSYPHGVAGPELRRLAQEVGYVCALTTELGSNDLHTDLFALRRVVIAAGDDEATFAARVAGLTGWVQGLRNYFGTRPRHKEVLTPGALPKSARVADEP